MKGRASMLLLAVALGTGALLYQVAYSVQAMKAELTGIDEQIRANRDATHVLQAEWSHLNQPRRLSPLSERHLGMAPAGAERIVDAKTLPMRGLADALIAAAPRPKLRPDRAPRRVAAGDMRSTPPSQRRTLEDVAFDLIGGRRR